MRKLSPLELTRALLERISALDKKLHAYWHLMGDQALSEARQAEAEILQGRWRGPLHGIPVAVKDQLDVRGAPAAIRQLKTEQAKQTADATVVRRLREAGAVILGKLAMSGLPGNPPPAINPWQADCITGGSSTGAGAAVAASLCMGALGEDTVGSIRNPASLCGIVGLKPTYGRMSQQGAGTAQLVARPRWPHDLGCRGRGLPAAGPRRSRPHDPSASTAPVPDYSSALREDVKGMVIGVPRHFLAECASRTDPEIFRLVEQAIAVLSSLGGRIEEVTIPSMSHAYLATSVIYSSEYTTGHFQDAQEILAQGALSHRGRIYMGLMTSAADYLQAQRLRSRLQHERADVFRRVDVLALPCQLAPAPLCGDVKPLDTLYKHLLPEFHAPFNLTGLPAISVPCGFSRSGLPVALQLAGKPFDEPAVLRAAYSYQQQARWHEKRPSLS